MTTMAEPATTDLIQLDAFHALLPALAGSLDIREVFQHLSAVASRIVPHDEANLALATDDRTQFRLYASTREGAPDLVCRGENCILREPIVPKLMDTVPGLERGLRSGVCAPVLIGDAVVGVFALFARRPHAYTAQDLALVQRLAGYVAVGLAHQRLAEAARRGRAGARSEHRILGGVTADDRRRPRHPHRVPTGLRDREQSAAARSADDDVQRSRAGADRGRIL